MKDKLVSMTSAKPSATFSVSVKERLKNRFCKLDAAAFNRLLIVAGLTGLILEGGLLLLLAQLSTEDIAKAELPVVQNVAF